MPVIPLGPDLQIWQLRAQWTSQGFSSGESSWSFISVRDPSDTGADLYALWVDNIESVWCSARPVNWALERVVIEDRFPQEKPPLIADYGSGLQPDSSGDSAPPATTPVITWTSDTAGRSYRGRTYWGPMRVADISDGWHLTGDAETALFTFGNAMLATFGVFAPPDNPAFAIVSRVHDGLPRDTLVFVRVIGFNDRQYLGTMRRRNHAVQIFS